MGYVHNNSRDYPHDYFPSEDLSPIQHQTIRPEGGQLTLSGQQTAGSHFGGQLTLSGQQTAGSHSTGKIISLLQSQQSTLDKVNKI